MKTSLLNYLWVATLILPCTKAMVEAEFKIQLNEQSYQEIVRDAFQEEESFNESLINSFNQSNHYYDTSELLFKKNGVNIRVRTYEAKAIFSLKVKGKNDFRSLKLKADNMGKEVKLRTRDEYQCATSLEMANKVFEGKARVFDLDSSICEVTEDSIEHPLVILKDIVKNGLYISVAEKRDVRIDEIVKIGGNSTTRNVIPLVLRGQVVNAEVDKTIFPGGYTGYELELEVSDEMAKNEDEVREELSNFLSFYQEDFSKTPKGKTSITFMILTNDEEAVESLQSSGTLNK